MWVDNKIGSAEASPRVIVVAVADHTFAGEIPADRVLGVQRLTYTKMNVSQRIKLPQQSPPGRRPTTQDLGQEDKDRVLHDSTQVGGTSSWPSIPWVFLFPERTTMMCKKALRRGRYLTLLLVLKRDTEPHLSLVYPR